MCGIIGYVGPKTAEPLLVEGLRRVEYRGYDSTGLATLMDGKRVSAVNGGGKAVGEVGKTAIELVAKLGPLLGLA